MDIYAYICIHIQVDVHKNMHIESRDISSNNYFWRSPQFFIFYSNSRLLFDLTESDGPQQADGFAQCVCGCPAAVRGKSRANCMPFG